MSERKVREGDWVICRQFGKGGDLIAGQINSAKYPNRKYPRGRVETRSLTEPGFVSKKFMDIFLVRNAIVPKKKALHVAKVYEEHGKQAAKEAAVKICLDLGLRTRPIRKAT